MGKVGTISFLLPFQSISRHLSILSKVMHVFFYTNLILPPWELSASPYLYLLSRVHTSLTYHSRFAHIYSYHINFKPFAFWQYTHFRCLFCDPTCRSYDGQVRSEDMSYDSFLNFCFNFEAHTLITSLVVPETCVSIKLYYHILNTKVLTLFISMKGLWNKIWHRLCTFARV